MLKMEKKWIYPDLTNGVKIKELATLFDLSETIMKVLFNRGLTDNSEIEKFLNLDYTSFCDPFLLKDIEIAVELSMQFQKMKL